MLWKFPQFSFHNWIKLRLFSIKWHRFLETGIVLFFHEILFIKRGWIFCVWLLLMRWINYTIVHTAGFTGWTKKCFFFQGIYHLLVLFEPHVNGITCARTMENSYSVPIPHTNTVAIAFEWQIPVLICIYVTLTQWLKIDFPFKFSFAFYVIIIPVLWTNGNNGTNGMLQNYDYILLCWKPQKCRIQIK